MNANRVRDIFIELVRAIKAYETDQDSSKLGVDPNRHALIQTNEFAVQGPIAAKIFQSSIAAGEIVERDAGWSKEAIFDLFLEHLAPFILGVNGVDMLPNAGKQLLAELNKASTSFEKVLSVFGFAEDVTNFRFGQIEFTKKIYTHSSDFGEFFVKDIPQTLYFAEVKVSTIDDRTATIKSQKLLDEHLAVLNALLSWGYPTAFKLTHHFTEPQSLNMVGFHAGDSWAGNITRRRVTVPLDQATLKSLLSQQRAIRVNQLLLADTQIAERLISGYEIVGKASTAADQSTSFLLFAIALESAVLGNNMSEITDKLATRVAHLVSTSLEARRNTLRQVKGFYGTRSKIVHEGKADIADRELQELSRLCIATLDALCHLCVENGMAMNKELEVWFEERTLS